MKTNPSAKSSRHIHLHHVYASNRAHAYHDEAYVYENTMGDYSHRDDDPCRDDDP